MEALISAQEAMRALGVSRTFLTEHREELGGVKVGSRLKFRPSALEAYLRRRQIGGAADKREPTPIRGRRSRIADRFPRDEINPVTRLPWGATAR